MKTAGNDFLIREGGMNQAASATPQMANRRIRVFVSSTFRDMVEERNALMTHAWPELRRFCRDRLIEFVEVDMRWGIAEEQSMRNETLKLCLDEIRACRPFFIGLVGERYGWVPGDDALTPDLKEEQPWLQDHPGASVTELEVLHGVLNNPEMAERSFFYFRDPAYVQGRGSDFLSENHICAGKQTTLKARIRRMCDAHRIALRDNYPDPRVLATLVFEDLRGAIEAQFRLEEMPDPLTREAHDHEAFAETRRRTYIGRPDYFEALDRHADGHGGPLVLLGDSGGGKSALLANWLAHWRTLHGRDVIFQHYVGGTPDSTEHWRLMIRLIAEIKRWSGDPEELPHSHNDVLKMFPVWLAKARIRADREGVRFIIVLDALNQLHAQDYARSLGWLPSYPFIGTLRLIVSTLPGETLEALQSRGWSTLRVELLTPDERRRMITEYLMRVGKRLDATRVERLSAAPTAANPLYLKVLLDELRVTGTHDRLDERLDDYLAASDVPALLRKVLARYQRDYERDRPGLVSEALGLIWASRRGLSETELLRLLRPSDRSQLPLATWAPLCAAVEDGLIDRGGILNFAHDFLRTAVEKAFVGSEEAAHKLRVRLAEEFEAQPINARSCDELPWLLSHAREQDRLRQCILDIERFLLIRNRDQEELVRYWVGLGQEREMGRPYLTAFEAWSRKTGDEAARVAHVANELAVFLNATALYADAEPLMRRAIAIDEQRSEHGDPGVSSHLHTLAQLLFATNRMAEAEPLMRRALAIDILSSGQNHSRVARSLNNLAQLFKATNRMAEAEPLMRRALAASEQCFGPDHPDVATCINNLAVLLQASNRVAAAEPLMRRALAIDEKVFGPEHPSVGRDLNNLAQLLRSASRLTEAEPLMRRALAIDEQSFGPNHPNVSIRLNNLAVLLREANHPSEIEPLLRRALAIDETSLGPGHPSVSLRLNNLALFLQDANRLVEAEPLLRRALAIDERCNPNLVPALDSLAQLLNATNRQHEAETLMRRALAVVEQTHGMDHPKAALRLYNLGQLLQDTDRLTEAEPLIRRALAIDEKHLGPDHPDVAVDLNGLAQVLWESNRLVEAEPPMRRHLEILLKHSSANGRPHRHLRGAVQNYVRLLRAMGRSTEQVSAELNALCKPYGI